MAVGDELDFSGKTMLVTGSGRNIGRAIVLEFAARGANVVVNARSNRDEAEAVADEARAFGVDALVTMGAPAERSVVDEMARAALERFGRVDMYVSNAARRPLNTFWDTTDEDWHHFLNQQLTASWYLAKAFAPAMREAGWGRIIHMNGPDGYTGGWARAPHAVAKGGLRTLTKSLASGLGEFGITVNDINPGFTDSVRDPATHPFMIDDDERARWASIIPIRRFTTLREVAFACVYLCSDMAGCVNGSIIHTDGGHGLFG